MDKGKGEGGQQKWIKMFSVNIINFAKVDKGGGDAYTQKVNNFPFFNPSLTTRKRVLAGFLSSLTRSLLEGGGKRFLGRLREE